MTDSSIRIRSQQRTYIVHSTQAQWWIGSVLGRAYIILALKDGTAYELPITRDDAALILRDLRKAHDVRQLSNTATMISSETQLIAECRKRGLLS